MLKKNLKDIALIKSLKYRIRLYRIYIYYIFILLWAAATIYTINLLGLPDQITDSVNDNNIIQDTNFQYQADVKPYPVNPKGGLTDVSKSIFTNITNDIKLRIAIMINSDKPVKIQGVKKVVLKIRADEFWEKEFVICQEEAFDSEGIINQIYDDSYSLGLSNVVSFITRMEDAVKVRASKYVFEVIPLIDGTIKYNGKDYPISINSETYVEYSDSIITFSEENAYTSTTNLTTPVIVPQSFNFFDLAVPVKVSKIICFLLYALFTGIIFFRGLHYIKYRPKKSEIQYIEKKYKARFIPVLKDINPSIYEAIQLDSITSLIKLSDEKEILILKYICEDKMYAAYYLIDGKYMYFYRVNHTLDDDIIPNNYDYNGSEIA